jgi:hypothetical protein
VTLTLDAALTPFDGNYRAAMQRIHNLMQTLQATPAIHSVSLRSSPVDADSSSTLSGQTLDAALAHNSAARFSLSLTTSARSPREVQP